MAQNNHFFVGKTINCNGKLLNLEESHIMGILNTTPDSFFDGGKYTEIETAMLRVEKMVQAGVKLIDIGGYSTRPGAADVTEQEEINRVLPVIAAISEQFPGIIISIDTFRAQVAKEAILAGAGIINDISGFQYEPEIINIASQFNVPYVLMHMKGTPKTMQENPFYENVIEEVTAYFEEKISFLKANHIHQIILDLGFGFAKNKEHNYKLFNSINHFICKFNLPQLVGISHKRMVKEIVGSNSKSTLAGTTVLNTLALQQGASFIRVHDVEEAIAVKQIMDYLSAEDLKTN